GYLAGRIVTLCRCLVDLTEPPWVELEGRRLEVHPVDAVKNSRRRRRPRTGFRLTYCHNATLGRRDFYRQLCLALGLSPNATAAAVFFAVSKHVEDLGKEKTHP